MRFTKEEILSLARSVHPFAVTARRHLHRHPELSYQEKDTSAYVASWLQELGYEVQTGVGGYGVKAVLRGGKPGKVVALRADMDALPIQEETGLDFASEHPGVMHACGHDVHTATLLGTARALKEIQADIAGTVVLIFQPGEEVNPGGASLMIKDGVLANPTVDAIFGLHVAPGLDAGTMGFGAGAMLASPDDFSVTIIGKGGHGAAPHLGVDPVMVAAQCLTLLQQVVARNVDPFKSAVLTIGTIHGGTAPNVIPDSVTFTGTIRTMDKGVQQMMPKRLEAVVRGVCEAAGASYKLDYDPGYPVLVNDVACTETARAAALRVMDAANVGVQTPSMGGEDFAFYLEQVPGNFGRLGASAPGTVAAAGLHTSRLLIDEECLATGVAYYLSVVGQFLG